MKRNFLQKKMVYLDWAAATPVCKQSLTIAFAISKGVYGNPSSPHQDGQSAREILEESRNSIARFVEVKADDVIFTSGATEANALAIRGHLMALVASGRQPKDIHFLYASTAHASIVHTAEALKEEGFVVEPLPITKRGVVDITALDLMLRPQTALVSMEAVCGETGTIWNTREVKNALVRASAQSADARDTLLHVDASAAPLTQNVTRAHWSADMLVFNAQKMCGMRGIGVLISHRTIPLRQLFNGGPQERSLRPGTQSVVLATAFARAFKYCDEQRTRFNTRAIQTRKLLINAITTIPRTFINESARAVPNILNLSLIGRDTDYLTVILSEAGFSVSSKSACETNTIGSRVVTELTGEPLRGASTLRISWGYTTTDTDIRHFIYALIKAIAFLDEHAK